jgi:ribosomal protein S18 acetylase RimI-like enzyme
MEITRVGLDQLDEVTPLFDLYRQFYKQPTDLARCRRYLHSRIESDESTIFLSRTSAGEAVGFTQLYATFCSVELIPRMILYDLYVKESARRQGFAKALMDRATTFARENGFRRLTLETAVDNFPGQALYEREGWERDLDFYTYHLPV